MIPGGRQNPREPHRHPWSSRSPGSPAGPGGTHGRREHPRSDRWLRHRHRPTKRRRHDDRERSLRVRRAPLACLPSQTTARSSALRVEDATGIRWRIAGAVLGNPNILLALLVAISIRLRTCPYPPGKPSTDRRRRTNTTLAASSSGAASPTPSRTLATRTASWTLATSNPACR